MSAVADRIRIEAQQKEIERLRDLVADLTALIRHAYFDGMASPDRSFDDSVTAEELARITGGLAGT